MVIIACLFRPILTCGHTAVNFKFQYCNMRLDFPNAHAHGMHSRYTTLRVVFTTSFLHKNEKKTPNAFIKWPF